MKLSALEIKQQKFDSAFRGYDPTEVQNFLKIMSNEWEHLAGRNRELEQQIETLQNKLKHYERVEEALHETLKAAKETAENKLVGARKEADHTIDKAEMEAEKIVRNAKQERRQVRQSIMRLLDRRKEIVGGIQSYLQVAQESVDQFSKDKAGVFERPGERKKLKEDEVADSQESAPHPSENKNRLTASDSAITPPGTENIDDLVNDLE